MAMFKKQKEQYEVEGFLFASEAEAEQAKKEREGVKYIRSRVDMDHPEQVLLIYNRMIAENMFATVVRHSYLKELQEYLTTISYVKKEDIRPIPVVHPSTEEQIKEKKQKEKQKIKKITEKAVTYKELQKRYQVSFMANIVLLICVVLMFAISATSNHPNILNYETEIINRYSAWEQELSEREAALRELENK